MNYTYKSRVTKKTYALKEIVDLPVTERMVLKNDLEEAVEGMRKEMYEERYRVNEEDKWFKAVSFKLGLCTAFLDEIKNVETLDMSEVDKVTLVFLRKKLQVLMGISEADRVLRESRELAVRHIKSIKTL